MGNPEAGSSAYEQPQEYQYEETNDQNIAMHPEFSTQIYEPSYYVEENQDSQSQPQTNEPQGSQQQQPVQFPPPQANQAYGAQPTGPARLPPSMQPSNQTFSNEPNRPAAYPAQGSQIVPSQPVNFPPPNPQNAPVYSNQHPGYPSQGPTQAVNFPPQSQQQSPVYASGQIPMPAQTTPMVYSQNAAQIPPTLGYQTPPPMQFQNNIGPQGHYGISVPNPGLKPVKENIGWSSSLFDCMNDPMNALITACFPCLTFGQIAEIVDEGQTTCATSGILYSGIAFCIAIPCLLSCTYRTKLRSKFNLPEAPAPDWVTHFLCEYCALCQEYRELQSRGWDPSIGWQGNIARNQIRQATTMAPMNQRMMG